MDRCSVCGIDLIAKTNRFCGEFYCFVHRKEKRAELKSQAHINHNQISRNLTVSAVRYGFLLPASDFYCVDCGIRAENYDHRDYNKPLDVVPVCRSCNMKRWKGIPATTPYIGEGWIKVTEQKASIKKAKADSKGKK
jgi:hypothetical protein